MPSFYQLNCPIFRSWPWLTKRDNHYLLLYHLILLENKPLILPHRHLQFGDIFRFPVGVVGVDPVELQRLPGRPAARRRHLREQRLIMPLQRAVAGVKS